MKFMYQTVFIYTANPIFFFHFELSCVGTNNLSLWKQPSEIVALNIYDKISTNITIIFASQMKSVHKLQIRPIVSPSIAPKNDLLIR